MSENGFRGRIDVHTHLLPGIDDGCTRMEESADCARQLVSAGYSHAFCTPHIWPSLPENSFATIPPRVAKLQSYLDRKEILLRLLPGGEWNLHALSSAIQTLPREQIVSFAQAGKFVLFDFWSGRIRDCRDLLHTTTKRLLSLKIQPILAHPERIMALQSNPDEITALRDSGVLLQMNLWCLTEPKDSPIYRTAERLLTDGKYFMFGTDCHDPETLPRAIEGLAVAATLVGDEAVTRMTVTNPAKLLPASPVVTSG